MEGDGGEEEKGGEEGEEGNMEGRKGIDFHTSYPT